MGLGEWRGVGTPVEATSFVCSNQVSNHHPRRLCPISPVGPLLMLFPLPRLTFPSLVLSSFPGCDQLPKYTVASSPPRKLSHVAGAHFCRTNGIHNLRVARLAQTRLGFGQGTPGSFQGSSFLPSQASQETMSSGPPAPLLPLSVCLPPSTTVWKVLAPTNSSVPSTSPRLLWLPAWL